MSPQSENSRGRIMVVDDERAQMTALCDTLADHCDFIAGFTSGPEALEALKQAHYDLLLSDLMMPEMDGITLLHLAQEADPDLVVIIMTGVGTIASAVDAMKAGAFDYIQKPFKLKAILPVLTRALAVRQLRQENRELEQRVRERTEETLRQKEVIEAAHKDLSLAYARLQSAQEQLVQQEIMASLGRLVAGVAHEANTPLSSILLSSTVIRERLESISAHLVSGKLQRSELESVLGTISEAAGVIERASDKAAQLIANFKQLATTQSDEQNCRIEVSETLDLIVASLQPALRAARVRVQMDVDRGAILTGNPAHFQKILLQLFSNALTHGFRDRPSGKVLISARLRDGEVVLAFSDDGVGIPGDVRNKVFEPFFTTQFGQGGSGLGLYLVYNMVTASLRGRISVESEPGKGTTFLLELPQIREVPALVPF